MDFSSKKALRLTERVSLRLSKPVRDEAARLANAEDVKESDIYRTIIEDFFSRHRQQNVVNIDNVTYERG